LIASIIFNLLKRFPPKWLPVRRKKTRQIKNQERAFDSMKSDRAHAARPRSVVAGSIWAAFRAG
jgi:hypothetical protein